MSAFDPMRTLAPSTGDFSRYDASPELGSGHATTRVYQTSQWCSGRVAVHRACAAAADVCGRIFECRIARTTAPAGCGLPRGPEKSDYVEGRNVAIEYRWAEGQYDRLPALVADLVRQQVSVIVSGGGAPAVLAAKAATTTIPIVFSLGADPVGLGVVASLNRPGGNITEVYQFTSGLEAKRLGLLHEMIPKATPIAVLVNPNFADAESQLRDLQEAAARLEVQLVIVRANAESDFDAAFSTLVRQRAAALLVCGSPFFNIRREQLVVLAARHAVPAIFEWRDFAAAGGLMSYGTSLADAYRQVGVYAGQILGVRNPPTCRWCNRPNSN